MTHRQKGAIFALVVAVVLLTLASSACTSGIAPTVSSSLKITVTSSSANATVGGTASVTYTVTNIGTDGSLQPVDSTGSLSVAMTDSSVTSVTMSAPTVTQTQITQTVNFKGVKAGSSIANATWSKSTKYPIPPVIVSVK